MEIHYNPHLEKNSKWKTYLLEFMMIFFAVCAGFLAERFREELKDKEHLHKYIVSMVADLKSDIMMFDSTMTENAESRRMTDSLISLLKTKSKNTSEIYYLARTIPLKRDSYYPNTKTFDQLKSSGGLRLIEQENILDSITSYYQALKWFDVEGSNLYQASEHVFVADERLFDGMVFQKMLKTMKSGSYSSDFEKPFGNPPLLTSDLISINSVIMSYHALCSVSLVMEDESKISRSQAKRLVTLLEKEYNLKD